MEQMTGLRARPLLGKHPDEVLPGFLREAGPLASIAAVLAGGPSTSIERSCRGPASRASGLDLPNEWFAAQCSGQIIGVIGTVRDITERKRAELRIAAFANLGRRLNAARPPAKRAKSLSGGR